jgi:TolA-binding protein
MEAFIAIVVCFVGVMLGKFVSDYVTDVSNQIHDLNDEIHELNNRIIELESKSNLIDDDLNDIYVNLYDIKENLGIETPSECTGCVDGQCNSEETVVATSIEVDSKEKTNG